jgi:nucleoside-diphosphate-sugar epimerase/mannose-6-phosphate isomerase-like protein (cupin superfamily)
MQQTETRLALMNTPGNEGRTMDIIFGFGQVGQALAKELVGRGKKVRVVSRSGRGPLLDGVDHVTGDATSPAFCRAVCTGAEVVYLCLNAPYDRWAEELPPLQEAVLAGAAASSSKLVVLENLYMYGPHEGPLTESLSYAATDTKGLTRARMSEALLAAHRSGRVRVSIGRASDFFGPNVIASQLGERAFAPLVAGKAIQMIGDPDAPHSYAYVPDVARGLATLGERPEADGRAWHFPSVETHSTREMLRLAAEIAGVETKVSSVPPVLLALLARANPIVREVRAVGYQLDRPFIVDSSAFERTFGIRATPLKEALTATVEWYRARAQDPRHGRGADLMKGLAAFTLDNLLIWLAILAVRFLVRAVPALSVIELEIAVAAGLYWLPPLRLASINIVRRLRPRRSPSSSPRTTHHRMFEGPSTKICILETAAETSGARLRFEQTLAIGDGRPPRHVHRKQTESFLVVSGRLGLETDGVVCEIGPGESYSVPPGTAHTLWNAGDEPCINQVTLEPALDMEHFFEGIVTLEAQHRLPPHGRPDLLRIALLFGKHDNLIAGIPRVVQRLVYTFAKALAWARGVVAPSWSEVARFKIS